MSCGRRRRDRRGGHGGGSGVVVYSGSRLLPVARSLINVSKVKKTYLGSRLRLKPTPLPSRVISFACPLLHSTV